MLTRQTFLVLAATALAAAGCTTGSCGAPRVRNGAYTTGCVPFKLGFAPYTYNKYEIDQILDHRHAASLKVGGTGMRYLIRIGNATTYLFHEDPRWYVEEKIVG